MKRVLRSGVLITIVIMSALMMCLPYKELKRSSVKELNEKQELIAKQTALSIENFFSEQRKMLKHFATHPSFMHFTEEGRLSVEREYQHSKDYIKAITLYDRNGIIKYSYPSPEASIGRDISNQPHVKKILEDHKPNISDVFKAVQGYKAVSVAEPIFDKGQFVGVIAFLIDFKYIARNFLEEIRIGNNGYAWMISRDGTELYCPVPNHTGVNVRETSGKFPEVISMAESMMRGEHGVATYRYDMVKGDDTEIVKKHAIYIPIKIENTFWSLVIATPENDIYANLSAFVKKMAFAMLLLVTALLFYVVISVHDYNLAKRNEELQQLVDSEIAKRQKQEQLMLQQVRFYSMTTTLSALAHQWRQPLNAIGLCVQDLEEAYENGELDSKYLASSVDRTMTSLMRLSSTIDEFSSFFEERKSPEKVSICDVIYNIYNVVRVQYDAMGIAFRFSVENIYVDGEGFCRDPKYTITTYPDKLKQVVLNCLSNAREAVQKEMESGNITRGEIWLRLCGINGMLELEIIDNGGGIDESIKDKIFDPYFSTKNESMGVGQGLYITRNIVEESLSGTIEIDNIKNGVRVSIRFASL